MSPASWTLLNILVFFGAAIVGLSFWPKARGLARTLALAAGWAALAHALLLAYRWGTQIADAHHLLSHDHAALWLASFEVVSFLILCSDVVMIVCLGAFFALVFSRRPGVNHDL